MENRPENRLKAHSLIIGVDFSRGPDADVLIVAKGEKGNVKTVVNASQGEEARKLYRYLVTPRNKEDKSDGTQS